MMVMFYMFIVPPFFSIAAAVAAFFRACSCDSLYLMAEYAKLPKTLKQEKCYYATGQHHASM